DPPTPTSVSGERTAMKASHTKLRRAALCIALGACLSTMAPVALAQSATGGVAGRATVGDQIVVTREATGLTRSATVGADGSYRLSQLPVGDYTVEVIRDGQRLGEPVNVSVPLGGTATLNLGSSG